MSASGQHRNIAQAVTQRMAMRGIRTPCRIDVQAKNGEVTLSGSVQYPHQRLAAVQAASTTSDVRHVVDRMTVKPAAKRT